jgi:Skp family chaperone for outer membrane proteins
LKESNMRGLGRTAAMLAAATLTGCGWKGDDRPAATAGAVAVIDLDEIAQRLGSDREIAESITKRQSALHQQLVDLAKSYNEQISAKKKELPVAAAEQSEVTVAAWQQQANANLNQVKRRAEADLKNHRTKLVQQFRDSIKPTARRVAQQRGLSVIVTKNDSVIYDFTAAADITDAVVDELLANASTPSKAAATAAPASAPQQASRPAEAPR